MDRSHQRPIARTACVLLLVFGLLQAVRTTDLLSTLTKPAVVSVLALSGVDAVDYGDKFVVGAAVIPWTRDCSGFDVLLVLLIMILWFARKNPMGHAFWIRLVLALPASVVVNTMRVLVIVAWRCFLHPSVESPQMHYFIGILCLVPWLPLFLPRATFRSSQERVELVLVGAVLCMVAGQVGGPGSAWVTASALVLLADQRLRRLERPSDRVWAGVWTAAAIGIGLTGMESLWMPWLLASPWTASRRFLGSPAVLLLLGTVPVFAMKFPYLVAVGMAWAGWILVRTTWLSRRDSIADACPDPVRGGVIALPAITSVFLLGMALVPFVVSSAGAFLTEREAPPSGMMAKVLEPGSYRLHLIGQSPDIDLVWYASSGSGRHHTLPVCMRYRGVTLERVQGTREVFTDGKVWMLEGFLMPDGSVTGHLAYLQRTFLPFSDPGVHLIATAPRPSMSVRGFQEAARALFARVGELDGAPSGGDGLSRPSGATTPTDSQPCPLKLLPKRIPDRRPEPSGHRSP